MAKEFMTMEEYYADLVGGAKATPMKKKGFAAGGAVGMKKKGMAKGGKVQKMANGGMMKKKGMAKGGKVK
tara:strand:+ start:2012 stop:2221 length:210 start_codon:yes stop_codon:yes gene_type:complete